MTKDPFGEAKSGKIGCEREPPLDRVVVPYARAALLRLYRPDPEH
jgi:hypothetical protein